MGVDRVDRRGSLPVSIQTALRITEMLAIPILGLEVLSGCAGSSKETKTASKPAVTAPIALAQGVPTLEPTVVPIHPLAQAAEILPGTSDPNQMRPYPMDLPYGSRAIILRYGHPEFGQYYLNINNPSATLVYPPDMLNPRFDIRDMVTTNLIVGIGLALDFSSNDPGVKGSFFTAGGERQWKVPISPASLRGDNILIIYWDNYRIFRATWHGNPTSFDNLDDIDDSIRRLIPTPAPFLTVPTPLPIRPTNIPSSIGG